MKKNELLKFPSPCDVERGSYYNIITNLYVFDYIRAIRHEREQHVTASTQNRHFQNDIINDLSGILSWNFNVKRAILAPFLPNKIHVEPQNIWCPNKDNTHIAKVLYSDVTGQRSSNHFRSEGDRHVKCSNNNNNKYYNIYVCIIDKKYYLFSFAKK